MAGMREAVERISAAVRRHERVFIHGDYDVDGITATAMLTCALRALGVDCKPFVPNRRTNGYGFKPSAVAEAKKSGATLIITVDCGITSREAAALCKREGIDVIITDHHEPAHGQNADDSADRDRGESIPLDRAILPEAVAIVNPKIHLENSYTANLSGAGIALKLVHAISEMYPGRVPIQHFSDLAALGTLADVVPLTGENRIIVKEGIKSINRGTRRGIEALKAVAGLKGRMLKPGLIVFTLIPRINAAGRIDDANAVVKLLLTDSEEEAIEIASVLEAQNSERQRIERAVYDEAIHLLDRKGIRQTIVLAAEGWHQGVIGIVASKLAEEFHRPVILFSVEGSRARGSARSIAAFDMYRALSSCRSLLNEFGGHTQAAGLELDIENLAAFEEAIVRYAGETLTEDDLTPVLEIDAHVELSEINYPLIKEIESLEPFGLGNPEPLLGSKGLEVISPRIVKDNHVKMKLRQNKQSFEAIGFRMAQLLEHFTSTASIDAVFTPTVSEWNDARYLQLHLKAIRPSR